MNYVQFGSGAKTLVILPGLADGLKNVKGQAPALAVSFRQFCRDFTVFIFSRKDHIEAGYSTREMAADQKLALDGLGIKRCCVMGVSQGGMIAQHLAIAWPETVEKLVLAVSAARGNETLERVVRRWMDMAREGDYKSLILDTMETSYSPKKLRAYRLAYPIISRIGKPRDFGRFIIQAQACLSHNALTELARISCPTLVVGGSEDRVVGTAAAAELAQGIPQTQLLVYEGLGHAAYEEGRDFNRQVIRFLTA